MASSVENPAHTLRPSGTLYRGAIRRELVVGVPVLLGVVAWQIAVELSRENDLSGRSAWAAIAPYLGILLAGVLWGVVYYPLVLKNTRIELGAAALVVTDWSGRTRTVHYSRVDANIHALIKTRTDPLPMLYLLDSAGKRVLRLEGNLWPREAMDEVGASTRVDRTTFAEAVTYQQLRRAYPRAIGWGQAYPRALSLITVAGILALIIVLYTVIS